MAAASSTESVPVTSLVEVVMAGLIMVVVSVTDILTWVVIIMTGVVPNASTPLVSVISKVPAVVIVG